MRLLIILLVLLGANSVVGQDRILTTDSVAIPCRLESVKSQLVRYVNRYNDQRDSLPTLRIRELRYADSLRVLVLPVSERGQLRTVSFATLAGALQRDDYAMLLHSKAPLHDLTFLAGQAALTLDGRKQTLALAILLKAKPQLRLSLAVYTDTVGKAMANKALSERRATTLRMLLTANGVPAKNLTVDGLGEAETVPGPAPLNRRVELRVTGVDRVRELYGETYIPPRQSKSETAPAPEPVVDRTHNIVPKPRKIGLVLYGEGLYALESLAKTWVDPERGVGILQGFGGGAQLTYYLTPRFGLSLQGGYGKWQVQRRYTTEEGEVIYTNDQDLKRILGQVGFRLYVLRSVYLQPMGGGQLLTLTSQNSDTHPEGALSAKMEKFMPTFGGSLGFEIGKGGIMADIAAQYQMTPNTDFASATGPLHYVGVRLGIGFRLKTNR